MSETRHHKPLWQAELDSRGLITAPWAEKYATASLVANFEAIHPHVGEFNWKRDLVDAAARLIWQATMSLAEEGLPVDSIAIAARLTEQDRLDELPNGMHYLLDLVGQSEGFSDPMHFAEWLEIIANSAAKRRLLDGVRAVAEAAENTDLRSIRSMLSRLADELPPDRRQRESTLEASVDEYLTTLATGVPDTMYCGIPEIDQATGGVAPGELIIVGGRPAHGKTIFGMQTADATAVSGRAVLVLSEEMSRLSLAKRSLASITVLDSADWKKDIQRVRFDAREHFADRAPIVVRESCGTIDVAERAIAQAVRKHDIKLCVVDYAQLLKGAGTNRYEQVSDVSSRLKRAATKYGITVLLLAQLSRAVESRPDPTPTLADLKDSGQLEQDADVVLFVFWPIKLDPHHPDPTEYRVYQSKNRNRGIVTPIVQMRINPNRQRLEPYDCVPEGF